jgi:RNA polymerase sigma factor (sigma-70 family)
MPEQVSSPEAARWFAEQVEPHEPSLRSYLKNSFPTVRDLDDIVQESYLRLIKARAVHPIHSPRAFLFSVAQRVAVDVIRREKRTTAHDVVVDFATANVSEDIADAADRASVQQEIALLAEAIHALPGRCREIMILRKLERLSHREIAHRLGISTSTVEVQISRGMQKCTKFLRSRGVAIPKRRGAS